ncbi:hypothetical protein FQN54_008596 [Arachnomyces sp. PD_36]|nr:hypothetical protein FQN54_008596 [Arachnomyces sp. PD_36]
MSQEPQDATSRVFRVLLLGDEGVGKTSLGKWCQYGNDGDWMEEEATETGIYRYNLDTNRGTLKFDVLDIGGRNEFEAEKDKYTEGIDGAIIIFDVQDPGTYDSVPLWFESIPEPVRTRTTQLLLPVVLCGNKVDLPYRRMGPEQTKFHREQGLRYYDISVRWGGGFIQKVFISIAKAVLEDQYLDLPDRLAAGTSQVQNPEASPNEGDSTGNKASGLSTSAGNAEKDQGQPSIEKKLNLQALTIAEPYPDSGNSGLQNIRPQIEAMFARLRQVPEIAVESAAIGAPARESEIEKAKKFANGSLPTGVEDFYRQIGWLRLEWKYQLPEDDSRHVVGHINIRPIDVVFGDNWREITWFPLPDDIEPNIDDEWRYIYRKVLPFDRFVPEACTCFIQEPDGSSPEEFVAFFYLGEELSRTRYTFTEYIHRLFKSHGYFYWVESLCPGHEDSTQVENFWEFMTQIYGEHDMASFRPR